MFVCSYLFVEAVFRRSLSRLSHHCSRAYGMSLLLLSACKEREKRQRDRDMSLLRRWLFWEGRHARDLVLLFLVFPIEDSAKRAMLQACYVFFSSVPNPPCKARNAKGCGV